MKKEGGTEEIEHGRAFDSADFDSNLFSSLSIEQSHHQFSARQQARELFRPLTPHLLIDCFPSSRQHIATCIEERAESGGNLFDAARSWAEFLREIADSSTRC